MERREFLRLSVLFTAATLTGISISEVMAILIGKEQAKFHTIDIGKGENIFDLTNEDDVLALLSSLREDPQRVLTFIQLVESGKFGEFTQENPVTLQLWNPQKINNLHPSTDSYSFPVLKIAQGKTKYGKTQLGTSAFNGQRGLYAFLQALKEQTGLLRISINIPVQQAHLERGPEDVWPIDGSILNISHSLISKFDDAGPQGPETLYLIHNYLFADSEKNGVAFVEIIQDTKDPENVRYFGAYYDNHAKALSFGDIQTLISWAENVFAGPEDNQQK